MLKFGKEKTYKYMSKIGRQPIKIAQGVTVAADKSNVKVTGPKGTLDLALPAGVSVEVKDGEAFVNVKGTGKFYSSLHGTIRSRINNNVKGVSTGWNRQLELVGTGFRAEVSGKTLTLTVGYSHPVKIEAPEGITFKVEKLIVTVEGYDRVVVGQVAANIRAVRPPEPYKGKGIKYVDEVIRRKPGKAAAKTTGA